MSNRRTVSYGIGIALTIAALVYLLYDLDWELLRKLFVRLQWRWLGLAFLTYFLNILLRALRFKNLIYSRSITWKQLVPISALHNLFMYLMPAKTGDVSYILLIKKRLDIPPTEGAATLVAVRFYDFGVVTFILACILPFVKNETPGWIFQTALVFIFVGSLCIMGVLSFLTLSPQGRPADRFASPFMRRVSTAWNKLVAGLVEIKNARSSLRVALITTGIWLCVYTNYYLIARGLAAEISYLHISIISVVMVPLTLLPIQGFANAGTHEIGWMSVLIAFGYPYDTALAIAVGSHFLLLISILLSAGISLLIFQIALHTPRSAFRDFDK